MSRSQKQIVIDTLSRNYRYLLKDPVFMTHINLWFVKETNNIDFTEFILTILTNELSGADMKKIAAENAYNPEKTFRENFETALQRAFDEYFEKHYNKDMQDLDELYDQMAEDRMREAVESGAGPKELLDVVREYRKEKREAQKKLKENNK